MTKRILISTAKYGYLAERIRAQNPSMFENGEYLHRDHFKDGEKYHRWLQHIDRRVIVIVAGTIDDTEFVELCDLICMSKAYNADEVIVLIPCFGYQTMERAVYFGEDVKAKNRARTISYQPHPRGGLTVAMFDLHADGVLHYFENNVVTSHLYSKSLVGGVVDLFKAEGILLLGATDAGRAKWVNSLALDLGLGVGFVLKNRAGKDQVEEMAISARVRGCNVFIFDDMLRTGTTAKTAAHAYRRKGARKIWLMCTHAFSPGNSLEELLAEKDKKGRRLFYKIVLVDTTPRALELAAQYPDDVIVVSSAEIFANYLKSGNGLPYHK